MAYARRVLERPEVPQFTPRAYLVRVVSRTPAVPTAAIDCFFTVDAAFAVFASARQPHRQTVRTGLNSVTRLQNSLYATTRSPLLALHRPGLLRPSFHRGCRHPTASAMTKRVSVNSRCRTFTGKTRGLMGCEQRRKDAKTEKILCAFAPLRLCVKNTRAIRYICGGRSAQVAKDEGLAKIGKKARFTIVLSLGYWYS